MQQSPQLCTAEAAWMPISTVYAQLLRALSHSKILLVELNYTSRLYLYVEKSQSEAAIGKVYSRTG